MKNKANDIQVINIVNLFDMQRVNETSTMKIQKNRVLIVFDVFFIICELLIFKRKHRDN